MSNDNFPDLARLKALALAATPGPWMRLFGERTVYDRMEDGCRGKAIVRADVAFNHTDAQNLDFIVAANPAAVLALITAVEASKPPQAASNGWQPIETAPQDGYMLVHEDTAIRALMRINGAWSQVAFPAIISHPWGDVIVGEGVKHFLPKGYRLAIQDGCCETPTHWMPLPPPPTAK